MSRHLKAIQAHSPRQFCRLVPSPGRILTLPPEISPSPRQPSAGRGLGRGASTGLQSWAAVAFRQGGLLSPTLSSKGGEGGPVVGWWQCQDALPARSALRECGRRRVGLERAGEQNAVVEIYQEEQRGRQDNEARGVSNQ